jgi:hypothetical protein
MRLTLCLHSSRPSSPRPSRTGPSKCESPVSRFYDGREQTLPGALEAFLKAGSPPVVFTLGSSAVGAAGSFYSESLQAVKRLRIRAVFLTGPHAQGLEETVSPDVLIWPAAPHAQLFARASVIVHQGGVGTTAQTMRSGCPMIVVPFAHDQFDNAERVRRLGVAQVVPRSRYSARTAETMLKSLLENHSYKQSALDLSKIVQAERGSTLAAQAIDEYARRSQCNHVDLCARAEDQSGIHPAHVAPTRRAATGRSMLAQRAEARWLSGDRSESGWAECIFGHGMKTISAQGTRAQLRPSPSFAGHFASHSLCSRGRN